MMKVELVDTHCHLGFECFDGDRDAVVRRASEAGVTRMVAPGLDVPTSRAAIALAERYAGVYAAVGVHPNDIGPEPAPLEGVLADIRAMATHPKVVAIGEIGLDYYRERTPRALQHLWLEAQLALAAELGLPVIIHNREATADVLALLGAWVGSGLPAVLASRAGVLHSFSAAWEDAQMALEWGFYLGFSGPVTFKKADEMRRVAALAPVERILVETDAPFLAPHPHRGQRNEPAYVRYVAEQVAQVRGVSFEQIAGQTTRNAGVLFGWEGGPI